MAYIARQLVIDERDGEPVDKAELRRLRGLLRPVTGDRASAYIAITSLPGMIYCLW